MDRRANSSSFLLTFSMAMIILSTVSSARATTYAPGVVPGNWANYGQVSGSWSSTIPDQPPPPPIGDFLQTSLIRTYVSAVSGQEVGAWQNRTFTNGAVAQAIISGNVETGQGNLTFWIISGGLSQGDKLYTNETAPTINATINRVYLGSARTVNVLNITENIVVSGGSGFVSATAYWDRPTGVLMEIQFTTTFTSPPFYSASGSAHAIITDTNLWTTQSDFAIYTNPTKTLQAGSSVDSKIYLTSLNGFAGDITLASYIDYQGTVNGLSAGFDRSVSKLTPDGTNSSILTVSAAMNTMPGYYTINVTGTSTIGLYHYNHYILVSVLVNSQPIPGTYVPGVDPGDDVLYGMIQTHWYSVLPISRPQFIADFENVGWVDIEVRSVIGTTVTAIQTWAFTNNSSPKMVTLTGDVSSGTGNLFPWIIAGELSAGDRTSNQPFALTINATVSRTYAGATRLVNVSNFTFSLFGVNSKLVYFWDKATGVLLEQYYDIEATGFVDGLADIKASTTNIWTPSQSDFEIASTPLSMSLQQGSVAISTITVTSLNGFAGTVQLSTVTSNLKLAASLDKQSVSLDNGQSETSTLTISSTSDIPLGAYSVNVTGSSDPLSHRISISLIVTPAPDFTLTVNSASLGVQVGGSTSTTITITPQNGFTGTVSLTVIAPNGMTVVLNPTTLPGYGSSTVTITTDSSLAAGSYNILVTATKGSFSHSQTVSVTVQPVTVSHTPSVFGLDPTVFFTGIVATVLAALSVLVFYLRRRSSSSGPLSLADRSLQLNWAK